MLWHFSQAAHALVHHMHESCHCLQVLVGQLLLDCIKAYNSLMPLVIMLPRQGAAGLPAGMLQHLL